MKVFYYFVLIALVLFVLVSFFYKGSNSKTDSDFGQEEFVRGSVENNKGKSGNRSKERSLFEDDSKFLEFSALGVEEFDSSEVTPEERERRRKFIIEKSKKLAEMFPNNSIIPRELSKEEAKRLEEKNQKMAMVQSKFLQNEPVSKEDKVFYYQERLKLSKDRVEIFKYTLGLQNGGVFDETKLDDFVKERYESILENEKAYTEEITKLEKE